MAGLDLNLLVPLQALLELRHVTRAAQRVHLTQSTMSSSLARLRHHFDDELLVRSGSSYPLTPLGQHLVPLVNEAMWAAGNALSAASGFTPLHSERALPGHGLQLRRRRGGSAAAHGPGATGAAGLG
ncbi:LysR family transcriptional regulator [Streptomyces sp. NPDC002623]